MRQRGEEFRIAASLRLDKWLWHARCAKTRSLAARLCEAGCVMVNETILLKPGHAIRIGDRITVEHSRARRRLVVVALGERRGPPAEARGLYQEPEPPERLSDRDGAAWTPLLDEEESWA